jgi:hypothetical protein
LKALLFLSLISISLFAQETSLGIVIGAPTGISGKYKLDSSNALQLDYSSSYAAFDYMWISDNDFDIDGLEWSYGAGVISKKTAGLRGITSADYKLKEMPFHVFGNVSFNMHNDEGTKTFLGIAIGARYIF